MSNLKGKLIAAISQMVQNAWDTKDSASLAALMLIHNKATGDIVAFKRADGRDGIICGNVDEGELPLTAAIRETHEEAGLIIEDDGANVMPLFVLAVPSGRCKVHCFYLEIDCEENPELQIQKEFECEGTPYWANPQEFIDQGVGNFVNFNRILLTAAGLIK